jgi:uncharacterized membrane protein YfcA
MTPAHLVAYAALGVAVGAIGTLIGAGGGFVLIPVLLFLHPHEPAANLTALSLAVVFANSLSGSSAYARMGRVDWRSALLFSLAGLPARSSAPGSRTSSNAGCSIRCSGLTLIVGAILVLARGPAPARADPAGATRTLVERDGTVHRYSPRIALGMLVSAGVGLLSSVLGIGGGIIHVPAMVYLLGFPTHVATATSHAVLALLTFSAVVVHAADGTLAPVLGRTLPIAAGALLGAQLGARLSTVIQGRWILRSLGLALLAVGVRLLLPR